MILFAADMSVTTSFPGFSHKDAWVNAQLRNPLATINLAIFISRSEFGLELKSWSLSMLSERVTHLHIQTHHKNPLDILTINQLINQSNTQSVSQSGNQSINQSNTQSVHHWIPSSQETVSFWVSIVRKRHSSENFFRITPSVHWKRCWLFTFNFWISLLPLPYLYLWHNILSVTVHSRGSYALL